ncbi:MAG: metallopeptidase TldD-related protein [Candidatus Kapaibacterium sp.]
MKKISIIWLPAVFLLAALIAKGAENPLLSAAEKEMHRTMKELYAEPVPPYYISYSITETKSNTLSASWGEIVSDDSDFRRLCDIDLRVGDYEFDNTHIIRGNAFNLSGGTMPTELPLSDDENSIRTALWFATDKTYKNAIERYEKAKTNKAVKVAEEDTSADFSREEPAKYFGDAKTIGFDKEKWKGVLKRLSAKFLDYPHIYSAMVNITTELHNKNFINTEDSKLSWYETNCRITVYAKTKADDGMSLPLYETYFAFTPEGLPSEQEIANDIDKMIKLFAELRTAPIAETFSGPAILSGEASGVFFHEIFGHRVEGHREKDPNSSQTFKESVGKSILPNFIDVVFDPTRPELEGIALSGYYRFDDEGVEAQKVVSVDDGIFKSFLMSRSPIEGFPNSNGHGRKQAGFRAVSRQSNLIVQAAKTDDIESLRDQLRKEAKKQDKEYGLYFEKVSGGFTFTNRTIPNAFNVMPLVVYKVYADGRPDELVRGVDLIGTPLTTFSNIIAAGNDLGVFNGICGAESGGVPVSACSPSLLVSEIEVQKKKKSQAKPPILPAPAINKSENSF